MGSYQGGRDGSSSGGSTDGQPDERADDQHSLDDYNSGDESSIADGETSPDQVESTSGGGSGASVSVVGDSPEGEADEPDEDDHPDADDCEEQEEQDTEDDREEEAEDEQEDEEEDETLTVRILVDPLSAMSWGIQPVVKRVRERYTNQVEIIYDLAPVRTFDDPDAAREEWIESTQLHSMPVDSSLWDDPPESTELLNRALHAARKQGAFETYLRVLWIEGIATGKNLSDEDVLTNMAHRIGLNVDQFSEDFAAADVDTDSTVEELPVTKVPIRGHTQTWTGYVHYADFRQQFMFEGIFEEPLPDPVEFVKRHGPVATEEVMEVYQLDREAAIEELGQSDELYSMEIGNDRFWLVDQS